MSKLHRTLFGSVAIVGGLSAATYAGESAVKYYPGADVVQITVVETQTATKTVEDTGTAFVVKSKSTTKREGTVVLKTIADVANQKTIDLQSRGLTDTTFAVDLGEDGLLRGVNLTSTGRFGDLLTSVAKFLGTVLILPGAATLTPEQRKTMCDGHAPEFAALSVNARYYIEQNNPGCLLAKQVLADQELLQRREREVRTAEDQLTGASPAEVAALQRRIQALRVSRDEALKTFAAHTESFAKALQLFEQEKELGTTPIGQVTRTEILQLSDLLQEARNATEPPIQDGGSVKDVEALLANKKAALDVFKRSRVTVTLEALPDNAGPAGDSGATDDKTVAVCFRQSLPLRLRVFLVKSTVQEDDQGTGAAAASPATVRQVSHSIENVQHPSIGLTCPVFKTSAFADRKLALTFDAKGRPQKIDRQGKSDVAAVAAGLASAASSFRDEYAASLKKLEEIQASRRNISLDDLTTRAARLKSEKAVLDAQLQLEGTAATFDSALKQQKLQSDLNALNAEIQLASAEHFREQRQEIEQLKLAMEQVQKTLELVRAEQELAKARK